MKKLLLSIFTILTSIVINAQSVNDSTSMEQFYTNQVFYSFANGETANVPNNNWDIAFSLSGQGSAGSAILLNEATSTLWQAPMDTTAWATFDSTGQLGWEQLLNSDTSWTNGAFNRYRGANSFFDMGWGDLNPNNNYWTLGDSIYLIKLGNGDFKKLWIKSLKQGVWNFTYADVNGANENSITITKTDYPNKNFIYVSLENGNIIDREPNNSSWDIMFSKHTDYVFPPGMYIGVTSVFNNVGLWTARSDEADFNAAINTTTPQQAYNQNVINIGRTWKRRVSGQWVVNDSIAYFAWNKDSTDLYRIVFTDFGGMTTGKSYFNITKIATVGISENNISKTINVYPNPANTNVTINVTGFKNNSLLRIYSTNGQLIKTQTVINGIQTISVEDMPKGLYIYTLNDDTKTIRGKLVIE